MTRTRSFRSVRLVHWLYWLVAVILAAMAVIVLLVITTKDEGRLVKDWRYVTGAYLDTQASTTGERGKVGQAVKANMPGAFTERTGYGYLWRGYAFYRT